MTFEEKYLTVYNMFVDCFFFWLPYWLLIHNWKVTQN